MLNWQDTHNGVHLKSHGCAGLSNSLRRYALLDLFQNGLTYFGILLGGSRFNFTGATDDDGLQLLRAHHRPTAAAADRAPLAVQYAGELNQVLTCRSNLQHVRLSPMPFCQDVGRFVTILTPKVGGVFDLHFVILNHQVDRLA
ncbi:hypothetical protein ES703_92353 [subsurface metagenome]